jgi:hypothetical protein
LTASIAHRHQTIIASKLVMFEVQLRGNAAHTIIRIHPLGAILIERDLLKVPLWIYLPNLLNRQENNRGRHPAKLTP